MKWSNDIIKFWNRWYIGSKICKFYYCLESGAPTLDFMTLILSPYPDIDVHNSVNHWEDKCPTQLRKLTWSVRCKPLAISLKNLSCVVSIVLLILNCTFLNTCLHKTNFWSMHHFVWLSCVPKEGEWWANSFTCVDVWSGYRGVTDLPPCPLQATISVKFHQHEVGRTGQRRGKSIWMMLPVLIIIAFST